MTDQPAPEPPDGSGAPNLPAQARPWRRVLTTLVWVVGLAIIVWIVVVAPPARVFGSDAERQGYAIGTALGALVVGAIVWFVLDRLRRARGGRFGTVWVPLIALVVLILTKGVQAGGTTGPVPQGTASAPPGSAPPASAYLHIASPYRLVATTSDDATSVADVQAGIRQGGFTDAAIRRVQAEDGTLAGFVFVFVEPDLALDPQQARAGVLESLQQKSLAPDATTIDGLTVEVYDQSGAGSAIWLDGPYLLLVQARDRASAEVLAKAVLDARP